MAHKQDFNKRFGSKVTKTGTCWVWTSATAGSGYGFFWIGGVKRSDYAHRIAYQMHKGAIPDGMVVMHSCDNKLCVNPAHLSVGTNTDNMSDSARKGRIAFGVRNGGGRKLTDNSVRRIKSLRGVLGSTKVGRSFGVASQTIKAIWRGRSWNRTPNCLRQALSVDS